MRSGRMGRVPTGAQIFVEAIQGPHVLRGDCKIEDIGVLADTRGLRRFGDHDQAMLDRPADQNLRRRLGSRVAGKELSSNGRRVRRSRGVFLGSRERPVLIRSCDSSKIARAATPFGCASAMVWTGRRSNSGDTGGASGATAGRARRERDGARAQGRREEGSGGSSASSSQLS